MFLRILILSLLLAFRMAPAAAQTCAPGKPVPLLGLSFVSYQADASLIGFSEYTMPSAPKKKYRTKLGAGSTSFDLFWSQDRSCTGLRWQETHVFSGSTNYDKTTGAITDTLSGSIDDNPCVVLKVTRTTRENSLSGTCAACWWTPYDQKATAANKTEFLLDEDTEEDAENRALPRAVVGTSNVAYRTSRAGDFLFGFRRVKYTAVFNVPCAGDYEVAVHLTARRRNDASSPLIRQSVVSTRRLESGAQTVEGTVVIQEHDVDYTVESVEARAPCAGDAAGAGNFELGSIRVAMSLGRGVAGFGAGTLTLEAAAIAPDLHTPAALRPVLAEGTDCIRDAAGAIRQVRSPQALADIVITGPASYEVRFYSAAQVGAKEAATGIYPVSGSPYVVYRIENPDPAGVMNRLRVTETRDGAARSNDYAFEANTGVWSLTRGNGLRRETEVVSIVGGDTVKTRTVWDAANTVVSRVAQTFHAYAWGQEMVREVADPDGAALTSTFEFYDTVSASDANYRRLRQRTEPSGAWERFTYAPGGRVLKKVRPFLNAGPATTDEALCRVTESIYDSLPDLDGDGVPESRTTTISRVLGQEIGRAYRIEWSRPVNLGGDPCQKRTEITATGAALEWSAPENLVTEYLFQSTGVFAGRDRRTVRPDGTVTLCSYATGADGSVTTVIREGAPNAARDDIVDGRRATTVMNAQGQTVSELIEDLPSGLSVSRWIATEFDPAGHVTRLDYADGTYLTRSYACCGITAERDRWGITTLFGYDALGRQTDVTRNNITTRMALDAEGRTKSVIRIGSDGSEVIQETNTYDVAGRLIERRDAMDRRTAYSEVYSALSGQATQTTIHADGGMVVVVSARDGSRQSVGGSAAAARNFEYGVDSVGVFTKEISVGADAAGQPTASEWVKSYTDFVGRPVRTVYPDGATLQLGYNQVGQLVRTVDSDGVTRLFAYNLRGEREITAVDLNGNGRIDPAGPDRIAKRSTRVAVKNEGSAAFTVFRTTTQIWESENADLPVVVSVSEQSTDGRRTWESIRGVTSSVVISSDGAGGRTQASTAPDGVRTTTTYVGDRLVATATTTATGQSLAATTYVYDAHGRVTAVGDARTGTTNYAYFADDRLRTVTTPDPDPSRGGPGYDPQTTTYGYDAAGRLQTVTHPDGGVVNTSYWPTGAVRRVAGARTYPVEYDYDGQGRIRTLTTWQNFAADSGRAVTTWSYDPMRGWPVEKRYAEGAGPRYAYKPSGRLLRRTWVRGGGLTTTYDYTAAGDPAGVRYSDQTPGVSLGYDRAGRVRLVQDAAGTRAVTYDVSGLVEDETYTAGLLAGLGVDRTFDPLQRLSSVAAFNGPTVLGAVSYAYDAGSRLVNVASGQNTATYDYLAGSGLVAGLTFRSGGGVRLGTMRTYDRLNRLESVQAIPSAGTAFARTYTFNAANQRTRATREDQTYWSYRYDPLGQVVAGSRILADGTPALGHDLGWSYDDIGNRRTAAVNGFVSEYSVGPLNQYGQRTVPGTMEVLGAAAPGATVTVSVNGGAPQAVTRQGELFFKQLPVDNSAGAQRLQLGLTGVKNLVGVAGEDAVTELSTSSVVPRTPEVFTYDADGNLTADAKWGYTWDAENRLTAMETGAALVAAGATRQRLEFDYDGGGRRISKKVFSRSGESWVISSHTLFLYDGFSLLAECDALAGRIPVRTYVWGGDLSGTRGGAAGVGGLLMIAEPSGSAHFVADDGRGNVMGTVQASTGAVSSRYDYSAFGEVVQREGAAATSNPWRFSTRYTDAETGLLYYGYRYLDPRRGRWISRDPVEEQGGLNLYGFVDNAPTDWVDPLGLALYAFDGTNNDGYRDAADHSETNVYVLYDVYQGLKKYSPGVGTNDGLLNPIGLAFGFGGQERIADMLSSAQRFSREGDAIADILGFSRGAAQARAFANKLREKLPCVKIRWIGLFDTVASEGFPNDVNIGYQLGIPKDTERVFHLTAGGERRARTFALTSIRSGPGLETSMPDFREVEIPEAAHSDVGGGYRSNRGLANMSLLMMWQNGRASGVPFGPLPSGYSNYVGAPHDSRWANDRIVEFVTGQIRVRKIYYHP